MSKEIKILVAIGLASVLYFSFAKNNPDPTDRNSKKSGSSSLDKTENVTKETRLSVVDRRSQDEQKFHSMPKPQSKHYQAVRNVYRVTFEREGFQLADAEFDQGTIKEHSQGNVIKNYTLTWLNRQGNCKIEVKTSSTWEVLDTKSFCF